MPEEPGTVTAEKVESVATPETDSKTTKTTPNEVDNVNAIDWGKYDTAVKDIFDKGPDAIAELISKKRSANEEAKAHRIALEELQNKLKETKQMDTEKISAEITEKAQAEQEALKAQLTEKETALLETQAKIAEYEKEKQLSKLGITPDFIDDAKRLFDIPEKEENETDEAFQNRLKESKDAFAVKYPQMFGVSQAGKPFADSKQIGRPGSTPALATAIEQKNSQAIMAELLRSQRG